MPAIRQHSIGGSGSYWLRHGTVDWGAITALHTYLGAQLSVDLISLEADNISGLIGFKAVETHDFKSKNWRIIIDLFGKLSG
jgi:hypothetical protein